MKSISLVTLVHGRKKHLYNLVLGLNQSNVFPSELIIIYMNESEFYDLPPTSIPLKQFHIKSEATKIPLAAARNMGAAHASHDLLVFLDVDCISAPDLISNYLSIQQQTEALVMGEIMYLPPAFTHGTWNMSMLREVAVAHPRRPKISCLWRIEQAYELFWSLNFSISKHLFAQINGFDTQYQGYGAEDTDFAFMARKLDIPFVLGQARAYHQHHPVYRPPLQHFKDIIVNARRFYEKWNIWPMDAWLQAFAELKLISWNKKSSTIEIIRHPSDEEVKAAYHEAPAGF